MCMTLLTGLLLALSAGTLAQRRVGGLQVNYELRVMK